MSIFITSDTHYNHKNIVRGCSEWEDKSGCRDFDSLEKHDEILIKNINDTVGLYDTLYHLGDWSFGGIDNVWKFRQRINCKNIHLILGNHDHHIKKNREVELPDYGLVKLQLLFSSVSKLDTITYNKKLIVMCHYSLRVWEDSHKGSIMLFGHSHGTLNQKHNFDDPTWFGDQYYIKNSRTMDVGIDTHPEFRPYHINEIMEKMLKKPVLLGIDHHNSNTK
jgi:calcineurin-like phosphoesterase family protein